MLRRQRAHQLEEIRAADILHRVEAVAGLLADVDDRDDVGMNELRRDPRFGEEHLDEGRIATEVRQHPLDHQGRRGARRARDAREIDLGHAAGRETSRQLVSTHARNVESSGREIEIDDPRARAYATGVSRIPPT